MDKKKLLPKFCENCRQTWQDVARSTTIIPYTFNSNLDVSVRQLLRIRVKVKAKMIDEKLKLPFERLTERSSG